MITGTRDAAGMRYAMYMWGFSVVIMLSFTVRLDASLAYGKIKLMMAYHFT